MALLVGVWSVVFLIFGAAIFAGVFAYRSGRLEVRMSAHPTVAAEAQRASEMRDRAFNAILAHVVRTSGPLDPAAVADELHSLLSARQAEVELPPGQQSGDPTPANNLTTTKVVDPEKTLSPKVIAGTATAATSAAFWIVAAATFWHTVAPTVLTALGTGVTAVTSAVAAWWKKDPLRLKQVTQSHPT